jgi:ESCRT-I complex subunit TSG101
MDADDQMAPPPLVPTPAPPRPPNPELLQLHAEIEDKLNSEFASLSQAMGLDAERLRAHQADLLTGEPAIRDEMARLEAVRDVCRGVSERLRHIVTQGEVNVAELRNKGDPPVDELLCSTTIVHNQCVVISNLFYHSNELLPIDLLTSSQKITRSRTRCITYTGH